MFSFVNVESDGVNRQLPAKNFWTLVDRWCLWKVHTFLLCRVIVTTRTIISSDEYSRKNNALPHFAPRPQCTAFPVLPRFFPCAARDNSSYNNLRMKLYRDAKRPGTAAYRRDEDSRILSFCSSGNPEAQLAGSLALIVKPKYSPRSDSPPRSVPISLLSSCYSCITRLAKIHEAPRRFDDYVGISSVRL